MSFDEFSRDFEILEDIVTRPIERIMRIRSRASGMCYVCRRINTTKLNKDQQQMLDAEIQLFQQLDGDLVTRYLKVLYDNKSEVVSLIMEYCDEGSLDDLFVKSRQRSIACSEEKARALVCQMARALSLSKALSGGLDGFSVIKSLTPKAILLSSTGKVKFKGFHSWYTPSQVSISANTDYIIAYTAPEVFSEGVYTEKSDVWGLGCILYEALTTKRCFSANTSQALRHKILHGEYERLPETISKGMRILIESMLHFNYNYRPTILDIRMALKVLSDADKTYHWDANVLLDVGDAPTPVADKIKKCLEPANVDAFAALKKTSSPVVSSYVFTNLKSSKFSEHAQLADRIIMNKTSQSNMHTSNKAPQAIIVRQSNIPQSESIVHTPSMSYKSSTIRGDSRRQFLSSVKASQSRDSGNQFLPEYDRDASQQALNSSRVNVNTTKTSASDSESLTVSNLITRSQSNLPVSSTTAPEKWSSRPNSVRLPSKSMSTKPPNLQFLAFQNAIGMCSKSPVTATSELCQSKTDAYGNTDMMIAAMQGNVCAIEQYLSTSAKMKNCDGKTSLMLAAERGHEPVVRLLSSIEGGIQLSLPDGRNGLTALMLATINNHSECVAHLSSIESGLQDENGNTALMFAAKNGFINIVEILMPKESRKVNSRGETALMIAAGAGQIECVRLLIAMETGMRTSYGWTALCFAVIGNRVPVVELLVQHEGGMQFFQQGCNGITALMIASEMGMIDAATILVEKELLLRNKSGETALEIAIKVKQTDMVAFLRDAENRLAAIGP